jgi:hypothetical protein
MGEREMKRQRGMGIISSMTGTPSLRPPTSKANCRHTVGILTGTSAVLTLFSINVKFIGSSR